MTTTEYGDWCNRVEGMSSNFETYVIDAFGSEGSEGFDIEAITAEYREAINNALPERVNLCGSIFYGPAYPNDGEFDGYPQDEYDRLDIREIVSQIDFWEIANKHRTESE